MLLVVLCVLLAVAGLGRGHAGSADWQVRSARPSHRCTAPVVAAQTLDVSDGAMLTALLVSAVVSLYRNPGACQLSPRRSGYFVAK